MHNSIIKTTTSFKDITNNSGCNWHKLTSFCKSKGCDIYSTSIIKDRKVMNAYVMVDDIAIMNNTNVSINTKS